MEPIKIENLVPNWLKGKQKPPLTPDDLNEIDRGIVTSDYARQLDYLWFQVEEKDNGKIYKGFRVVRLLELKFIPLDARADAGLLQKMRTVLRSIYGAKVSFIYLTGGLFTNPVVGIIQCYGVSVYAETLEQAITQSENALMALKSAMCAIYRQMKLEPLSTETGQWIFSSLAGMGHALVVVGQPDPRENAKGGSQAMFSNPLTAGDTGAQQYSLQQNEILFRGMSNLKEDFLFMVMTSPVSLSNISEMLVGLAEQTSTWAAWQTGNRGASFGISLPAMLSGSLIDSAATGHSESAGTSHTDGSAHSDSTAHSDGTAHSTGTATSYGGSKTVTDGVAVTNGIVNSTGQAISDSTTHTEGTSQSTGTSETTGTSSGTSQNVGYAHTLNAGVSGTIGGGVFPAEIDINGGSSDTINGGLGWSQGENNSSSISETSGSSVSDSASHGVTVSTGQAISSSITNSHSESVGESWSATNSQSDTTSQSDTKGQSDTASIADGSSQGAAVSNMLAHGASSGMAVGIAPSFSINNGYQWQFDPAILVTKILRMQQMLLEAASKEGAYYCDTYAFTKTLQGKKVMMGLVPESFAGVEDVVTSVQTRDLTPEEERYIIRHAQVFSPSTRIETIPEVMSGYVDSTLLTMLQVAAYTAPGMFEMGTATTVQEATPDFAYYPQMKGDVVLARQWASELGEVTDIPLRLSNDRHFHTLFCGDTGFGKSVAAEKLAYETTLKWHYRTIVLDFGQGWRRALNWSGLEGRVDIRQIFPGAQRPLRWNILQVPKRMDARHYRSMFCQLFTNAGRMGPRQQGFLRRAIDNVYEKYGVLPNTEAYKGFLKIKTQMEIDAIQARRDELKLGPTTAHIDCVISSLPSIDQQAVAVYRSKKASFKEVVGELKIAMDGLGKNDQTSRTSLEGLLLRVETFKEGDMAKQYGPGEDSLPIEDLGLLGDKSDPWGMVVIEGGAEMSDEFSKVALLSLLASVLYSDAVTRRREALAGMVFPPMQIFFEEANKILTGVSSGGSSDGSSTGGSEVSEIFSTMWRDGRKYKIFLHLMAQTISGLPDGIVSSCNNVFCVQTKNAKDRDMILAAFALSEKGFVNTEFKRYLGRIPIKMAIVKLGYTTEVTEMQPILANPTYVPGIEPNDTEIVQKLGTK
jgi:hypothetical protein